MSLVLQKVVKIPKLVNFQGLDGQRVIQLPTNAMIKVQSNKGNIYECPITNKTHYKPEELIDRDASFNAQVDTEKWTIYSISKAHEPQPSVQSVEQQREEYMELGGDY